MKEKVFENKLQKTYSKLLELKIEIQQLETVNGQKKVKWRELSEEIRSISQDIAEKKQQLLDSITKI